MTFTSVYVVTMKLYFGILDCTVDNDVGTGHFLLMLGILHVYVHTLAVAYLSGQGLVWLRPE